MERTLVILKPDCVTRGLVGSVISRFEDKGLKIVATKMRKLDHKILEEHYAHLKEKPFFPGIVKFMSSGPAICMIVEGKDVVEVMRKLCGATNARNAESGTIRGDLSMSTQCNIIHASDSKESAEKEIKRFFTPDEICSWERVQEDFFYAPDERKA